MTNTCPSYEWSRQVQAGPGNNRPCLLEQIIMMVSGPDNQSTCEGEICLNIGRSSPGVSVGASVGPGSEPCQMSITTTGGFYLIQHNTGLDTL